MTRSFARLIALVLLALMVLAGCQADVAVTVLVDEDTGGAVFVSVELDREAVERLEGIDDLRTTDLVAAGWEVADPVDQPDGGVLLGARKSFTDPSALAGVLDEISGPDGPYSRLGLRVDRSFARTEYLFEGVLDGSLGVDAFADPGLAGALDGQAFGVDLDELAEELGVAPGSLVSLSLAVSLPGDQEASSVGTGTMEFVDPVAGAYEVVQWRTNLAADDPIPVLVSSEIVRLQSIAMIGAAAVFAVLFLLILLVWGLVRWRRRRRRRKEARRAAAEPRPIPGAATASRDDTPVPASATPASTASADLDTDGAPDTAAPAPLQLVVIGGPGAAFGVRDPVDDVVAFARAHGSMLEYPRIAEHYGQAELGRISTAEMWVAVGAEGDPGTLDEEFLGQYSLAPGLREFVARARARGYHVAYLGDGPTNWIEHLRRTFVLGDLVEPWVISAAVGARTPEVAMFEALRRTSGVAPASCLLIDDRLRVLEAARERGYGTAWFSPTGRATEAPGHSIIRGFDDLLSS